ncbi:MAG: M12 family metallopeptidase [Solirubrobacteraceae bacterium]
MGTIRDDRRTSRWPGAVVPYSINGPISPKGRQQIDIAMDTWSDATPLRFVERTSEDDYVMFNVANNACFSMVGRVGNGQLVGCEYPVTPVFPAGVGLTFENQTEQQVDTVFVGTDGAIYVMWTVAPATWADPVGIAPPGTAPPGAPVALARQGDNQLDALFVDNDGAVNVMWVVGTGAWQGPAGLTPPHTAPAGAPIALKHQASDDQLDALFVDVNGVVNVMWAIDGDPWHEPVGLTARNAAPPGAWIALGHQGGPNQLDALFVDNDGAVNVMWVVGTGAWQDPVGLTAPAAAPPGAPIALEHQDGFDQLDAMFVDVNGVVSVMWAIGTDAWQDPVGLTPQNTAPAGAPLSLVHQGGPDQLDALFVDVNGAVSVMWVSDDDVWHTPVGLTPPNIAFPGSLVGVAAQPGDLIEAMIVNPANIPLTLTAQGRQPWSSITAMGVGYGASALIHELGHAIGLFHEQQRPDRDRFIQVNAGNVRAGMLPSNFDIPSNAQPLGAYDYGSIMHYPPGGLSAPGMGPTLQPGPRAPLNVAFGQASVPSGEDMQVVRYIYGEVTVSPAAVACHAQGGDQQLTAAFADVFGGISVAWATGLDPWFAPVQIAGPNTLPPGAPIALEHQGGPGQLDALFVDNSGAVCVMWVDGLGMWQEPVGLTPPNTAPPGARIGLAHQAGDAQLVAQYVGNDGAVYVMWVNDKRTWEGPVGITAPATAAPGAPIALEHQGGPGQLDALFVDTNGAVCVMWVTDGGSWHEPVGLTARNIAPPGSFIALEHQNGPEQLDALFVGNDGAVYVMWVTDGGSWHEPVGLTARNTAPPGAPIALAHQGDAGQLDALFIDNTGAVCVMWAAEGGTWQGPIGLTAPGTAAPGAPIALAHQGGIGQLDALFVGTTGDLQVIWVNGGDAWQGPAAIS